MNRIAWLLVLPFIGCSPTVEPDAIGAREIARASAVIDGNRFGRYSHDFGTLPAKDAVLTHEFVVSNSTDQPIRLLGASASTPCCSEVRLLPDEILAGGNARIPVTFKTRGRSGLQRLGFIVTTDAAEIERIELAVSANLLPTWEARIQEGSDQYLSVGRQGKQRFRCLTRSRGGEGLPAPESLKASSPLTASFAAPASEVAGDDGVIETTREVEVVIPADSEPGEKRGEVLVQ